jgi:hypothetical protein
MTRSARFLLAGSYFTLLVIVAWPLIETPDRAWTRQAVAVVGAAFLTVAALVRLPRWALIVAVALNVVIGVCCSGALAWQATHDGFDPILRTELPAIVYFLAYVPLVGAIMFYQQLRQGRELAQVQPNPSLARP